MFNWLFRRKENAIEKEMTLVIELMKDRAELDKLAQILHLSLLTACNDVFKYSGKQDLSPEFYIKTVKERFGYM